MLGRLNMSNEEEAQAILESRLMEDSNRKPKPVTAAEESTD